MREVAQTTQCQWKDWVNEALGQGLQRRVVALGRRRLGGTDNAADVLAAVEGEAIK
jgi:hypothetical protein